MSLSLPRLKLLLFIFLFFYITVSTSAQSSPFQFKGKIGKTLASSKEWWPKTITPPAGAPNVIWILIDDVGFGASSAFGGLIPTPTFDSLANNGLRFTNFHNCAICAPSRAALLTGRNAHYVHMGGFPDYWGIAGFPGYDGHIPQEDGTVAEILKNAGYATFAVGKYGLTPEADETDAGPFDYWPLGKGFDRFFGFLKSQTDQFKPDLVEDNSFIAPDGRHLSEQITDKAISYIDKEKKSDPRKPFFLYYAPGATHAPHQVPDKWRDIYKGKFDKGWDDFRQKIIANQKRLGIIPSYAQLPDRDTLVKAWNSLPKNKQKLYARFMEIYAAYLTYTDYQVGRLINNLKSINQLNNTLIFVMIGDNGASKEGTEDGVAKQKWRPKNNSKITEAEYFKLTNKEYNKIGTGECEANYPMGWAQACNTPFKYWKGDANAEGGSCDPLIIFYPERLKEKGSIRTQYAHISDVLPTTLQFIGIKAPAYINHIKQDTLQGKSMVYTFENPAASSRHTEQYYYVFGSRALYKDGWKAEATHHPDEGDFNSFNKGPLPQRNFDKDVWKLYDMNTDFNERIDLSQKYPEKLAELKTQFDKDAERYHIYPFIDWTDVFNQRLDESKDKAKHQRLSKSKNKTLEKKGKNIALNILKYTIPAIALMVFIQFLIKRKRKKMIYNKTIKN